MDILAASSLSSPGLDIPALDLASTSAHGGHNNISVMRVEGVSSDKAQMGLPDRQPSPPRPTTSSVLPPFLQNLSEQGEIVVTHEGSSQYAHGGASACGLASLNAASRVFSFENSGCVESRLLIQISKRGMMEEIMSICQSWKSDLHLDVDDIRKLPMIKYSMSLESAEHAGITKAAFNELLNQLQCANASGSAAAVITRPPEIITMFNIKVSLPGYEDLFVLFDSHPRHPSHPGGSAFTFFASLEHAADHLNLLFPVDKRLTRHPGMQWETQLLAQFSAHLFVPRSRTDEEGVFDPWDMKPIYDANVSLLEQKMLALAAERKQVEAANNVVRLTAQLENIRQQNAVAVAEGEMAREELESLRRKLQRQDTTHPASEDRSASSSSKKSVWSQGVGILGGILGAGSSHPDNYQSSSSPSPSRGRIKQPSPTRTSSKDERRGEAVDEDARLAYRLQRELDERDRRMRDMQRQQEKQLAEKDRQMRELQTQLDRQQGSQTPQQRRDRRTTPPLARSPSKSPESKRATKSARKSAPVDSDNDSDGNHEKDIKMALLLQQEFDLENQQFLSDQHKASSMVQPVFDCRICMDEHPLDEISVIEGCGHQFCRGGLKVYILSKLEDNWFPVLCPVCLSEKSKVPASIPGLLAEEVGLSGDEYQIWLRFELAAVSVRIDCPKCSKSSVVDREDFKLISMITCPVPTCSALWCKKCSQLVESPVGHSCDGTKEFDSLMESQKWKRCPGCDTPSSKDEGCNHMRCGVGGCNTHFCYVCGDAITHSAVKEEVVEAVRTHYSKCNLFDDYADLE